MYKTRAQIDVKHFQYSIENLPLFRLHNLLIKLKILELYTDSHLILGWNLKHLTKD